MSVASATRNMFIVSVCVTMLLSLLSTPVALGFSSPLRRPLGPRMSATATVAKQWRRPYPTSGRQSLKKLEKYKGATRSASMTVLAIFGNIEMSDLVYDDTSTAFDGWEWFNGMNAPAALVAAAVLVTLSETREETAPRKSDSSWTRNLKRCLRFLLLTSFTFEVISIFVGAMTGTTLLGHGPQEVTKKIIGYKAPLSLVKYHHEFEYLATQICFLQGLFHWLGAVAIELLLRKPKETTSAKRMNRSLAAWLTTFMFWMLAFWNNHINFYSDYASMLIRFAVLFWKQYIVARPFRPMSLLYGPSFIISSILTWRAFTTPPEDDGDDDDEDINVVSEIGGKSVEGQN